MSYDDGDNRWERKYEDTVKSLAKSPRIISEPLAMRLRRERSNVGRCEKLRKAGFNGRPL